MEPRPIITPSAPERRSASSALCTEVMSPFTITGSFVTAFTWRTKSQSATPSSIARSAMHGDQAIPVLAMRARLRAFRLLMCQPMHIFSVTAHPRRARVASRICPPPSSHQRRAGRLPDRHFFHRAAEIDVHEVGAQPDGDLRRLGHGLRLASRQLHRGRAAPAHHFRHAQRVAVLAHHGPGGDHLRDHEPRPHLLHQGAEGQVGHARERGEDHRLGQGHLIWAAAEGDRLDLRRMRNAHDLCKVPPNRAPRNFPLLQG